MKKVILLALFVFGFESAFSQNPQISGDLLICPWTNGTLSVTNQTYDTYQWYSKFWGSEYDYVAIPDANQASFTYDWYTYGDKLFKVIVTLDSVTYESDETPIESHNWSGMSFETEFNDSIRFDSNTESFLLCEGGSFPIVLNSPWTENIKWFRNGEPIEGANQTSYTITEPGIYFIEAAPTMCPDNIESSANLPFVVETDEECNLGVHNPALDGGVFLYPNPVNEKLFIHLKDGLFIDNYTIIDVTGKVLVNESNKTSEIESKIDVSYLSSGSYLLKVEFANNLIIKRFIKN